MKKIITLVMLLAALFAGSASAELQYAQVGTIKTGDYQFRTSNYPVYTMSKYGEGLTLYKKAFLSNSLAADVMLKQITYFGYQGSNKDNTVVTFTMWLANTTENTANSFVIPGETENGKATTVVDTSKMTKFAEVVWENPTVQGSATEAVEIVTFTNENGFKYTGDNLLVYVSMSCVGSYPSTTFMTANNGTAANCVGGYRESGYNATQSPGYSIYTKDWRWESSASVKLPVMKVGYEGAKAQVTAVVSGQVKNAKTTAGIKDATVTFDGQTVVTPNSGAFSFTVEDVDVDKTYTLTATAPGYDSTSVVVDIKSGGNIRVEDVLLNKLPVPAVLSGKVINKSDATGIAGASLTFNGQSTESAADGAYSFSIADVDELPEDGLTLTASAKGFVPYSSAVSVTGDMTMNVELSPLPALPGEGVLLGDWDPESYEYLAPFNTLWGWSNQQIIYPAEMFEGVESGTKFSSLSFYGYYPESKPVNPDPDEGDDDDDWGYGYGDYDDDDYGYGYGAPRRAGEVKTYNLEVYAVDGDLSVWPATGATPVSVEGLAPLYSGTVAVEVGGSKYAPVELLTLELTEPLVYTGKPVTLVVNGLGGSSALCYFCTTPTASNCLLYRTGSTQASLEVSNWSVKSTGLPVMRLGAYVATATVSGIVTELDNTTPVADVTVKLTGNGVTLQTVTDENGAYTLSVREPAYGEEYRLAFSKTGYVDETKEVTFAADSLEKTVNASLESDTEDGVAEISAATYSVPVYNAAGIKVADSDKLGSLPRGLYIINGKKIIK